MSSFIRQLYLYGFKSIGHGSGKVYSNPKFRRDEYSNTINVRTKGEAYDRDELNQLKTAYMLLTVRYDDLWLSTIHLKQDINNLVRTNYEKVTEILEFQFHFVERVKALALLLSITSTYYDWKLIEKINDATKKQSYIQIKNIDKAIDEYRLFNESPDVLKPHVEAVLMTPASYNSYLAKILKGVLREFGKRYFHMPFKSFYASVLKYVLRDEYEHELAVHYNYAMMLNVKINFEIFYRSIIGDYVTDGIETVFRSMYKTHRMEILPLNEDYPESSVETQFSMRSFDSSLGFNDVNLFLFLRPDLDD